MATLGDRVARAETQLQGLFDVIYGKDKGGSDGLVRTIANLGVMVDRLGQTVAELAASVAATNDMLRTKVDVALDEDGEPISVKRVNKRLTDIERKLNRALWFLAIIGLTTVLILGRVTERMIEQGHF